MPHEFHQLLFLHDVLFHVKGIHREIKGYNDIAPVTADSVQLAYKVIFFFLTEPYPTYGYYFTIITHISTPHQNTL